MKKRTKFRVPLSGWIFPIALVAFCLAPVSLNAMTFDAGEAGKMEITGAFKASFGATQYLDFVDDNDNADDLDFDATRELGVKTTWIANDRLKGVVSFQIGEGSTGGYFGSRDAAVGGEEDGDLILELDNLYIDYTTESDINFKIGSMGFGLGEIAYGSNILYETPAGAVLTADLSESAALETGWFRIADLMDDTENNTDDQADFVFLKSPVTMDTFKVSPWAGYALIGEDVIRNAASYWTYSYFDYPGLLTGTGAVADATPNDDVSVYYIGARAEMTPTERLSVSASVTYGDLQWDTSGEDVTVAGYFTDLVADYKLDNMTFELFGLYGNGPDAGDEDIDMMPTLIGGPTYTTSYFGGSRFNDNMFDSHDAVYATSMMAAGFKVKDIKTGEKLTHEFQLMYAEGDAEDTIFESPDDTLLNEDESFVEVNFNSEYQVMESLLFATEFGYIAFDEDSDYNEAAQGDVKDFWKAAAAIEFSF